MDATLVQPKRTRGKPTADGDFVVYEHVPIFDEHIGDDGTVYDERVLRAIAENCNRRIRTTGDWCPIVICHTRDEDEKATVTDDPPVVGLAGPFYVADWVNAEGEQVKCIFATFWVFAECDAEFRRYPRRSVEIWPEEKPENRYFDPIAVLGAETPKRDLGMIYSRPRKPGCKPTRHCITGPLRYSKRYSAKALKYEEGGESAASMSPGPNNTFIAGSIDKKRPVKNQKGDGGMPLAPEDIQQIVEALKPTIQSILDERLMSLDETTPPDADLAPVADDFPDPSTMSEEDQLYAKGLGRKMMKYFKDGDFDGGADGFVGALDDDDKKSVGSYMKYMCEDDGAKQKYAERYAKSPIGGADLTEKPGDSDPSASMNTEEMKNGEPEKYAKVRRERDDVSVKYQKLNRDHQELKQRYARQEGELVELRKKEKYSKRLSRLKDLEMQGYCFDSEDEMVLTEDFSEEQFDRHIDQTIPTRYSKTTGQLFAAGAAGGKTVPDQGDDQKEQAKKQHYAKVAMDAVQKYRKSGKKNVDYGRVLEHVIENDGKIVEEKLFPADGNGNA